VNVAGPAKPPGRFSNVEQNGAATAFTTPSQIYVPCARMWVSENRLSPAMAPVGADKPQPRTTLMLTNLPADYSRERLIALLNNHAFAGQYDFVFLPIDFKTHKNQGMAFVNLVNGMIVPRFWKAFDGFGATEEDAGIKVAFSNLQGHVENVELHMNSALMHEFVPDEFKPAIFSLGARCPFPAPTKKINLPEQPAAEEPVRVNGSKAIPAPVPLAEVAPEQRSTVMLKNLPTNYTREMLTGLFDNKGFRGQYDFMILPINFRTHQNQGYAHVNLVDYMVAAAFWDTFHGFSNWWCAWGQCPCEITWSPVQGLDAHIERYRNSPLMYELIPDDFKPAIYSEGVRVPFPAPTKKVRAPRIRRLGLTEMPTSPWTPPVQVEVACQ